MNRASVLGILIGVSAILGGNFIEGGRIGSIVQGSAAVIVFGGTLGATFLSFSLRDIRLAARSLRDIFFDNAMLPEGRSVIREAVNFATKSRRTGMLSLDMEARGLGYDFFRSAMRLAIDGLDPKMLRNTLERENLTFEEEKHRAAKVFEAAGGYAPTTGIIGAVLGLIHVMENLGDPARLGTGIAVAFVATVYGVGSANLFFLPMAKKIINNMKHEVFIREIIIEGVLGIQSGRNPFYLKEYLNSFLSKGK
ncbi:MAG: flagellar motor protein [Nitrospiraceae bacterium]|nr:MAG: flagellar motor protein [Nitrospiraceae bacterium]